VAVVAEYNTITEAVAAGDMLAAAKIRLRLLDEAFVGQPQLRSQLSTALERAAAEVERLMAMKPKKADEPAAGDTPVGDDAKLGRVVPFDADRYRKSG
jgi:hypothetical protein